jgi:hypothetical protein
MKAIKLIGNLVIYFALPFPIILLFSYLFVYSYVNIVHSVAFGLLYAAYFISIAIVVLSLEANEDKSYQII